MKKKVFGLCGWSGSGKTDLICRLINYFSSQNLVISTIKHTHHNFTVDRKGKDSFLHKMAGAFEVLISGEYTWAQMHYGNKNEKTSLSELINKISLKTDIILVEGFKQSRINKLEVFNSTLNKPFLYKNDKNIKGIIIDKKSSIIKEETIKTFFFEQTEEIANFILEHAKDEY